MARQHKKAKGKSKRTATSTESTSTRTLTRSHAGYQLLATVEQRTEIARLIENIDCSLEVAHLVTRNAAIPVAYYTTQLILGERALISYLIEQALMFTLILIAYPTLKFLKSHYVMPRYHMVDAVMPNMTADEARNHINILSHQLNSLVKTADNIRYLVVFIACSTFFLTTFGGVTDFHDAHSDISSLLSMQQTMFKSTALVAMGRAIENNKNFYAIKHFSEQVEYIFSHLLRLSGSKLIKVTLPEVEYHNEVSSFMQHLDNPFWKKQAQVFLRIDYHMQGIVPPLLLIQMLSQQLRGYFPQLQILMAGRTQMSMSFPRGVTLVTQAALDNVIEAFEQRYKYVAERYREYQQIKSMLLTYFSSKRMSSTYVLCELVGDKLYLNISTRSYEVAQHLSATLEKASAPLPAEDTFSTWNTRVQLSPALLQHFKQILPAPVVEATTTTPIPAREISLIPVSTTSAGLFAPTSSSSHLGHALTASSSTTPSPIPQQPKPKRSHPSNKDVSDGSLWVKQRLPVFKAMQDAPLLGRVLYHTPRPQFDGNYAVLTVPTTVPDYPMFVNALTQASHKTGRFGLAIGKMTDHKADYYGLTGKIGPDGQLIKSFYEIHTPGDTRVIGYEIERNASGKRLIHFCVLAENVHSRPTLTDYSVKSAVNVLTL